MSAVRRSGGGLNDEQKKRIAVVVFVVIGLGLGAYQLQDFFGDTKAPAPAAPVIVNAPVAKAVSADRASALAAPVAAGQARKVATASGALDPTLHMDAMLVTESLKYTGAGRNIFATGPAANIAAVAALHDRKPLPQPIAPVRVADMGPPPPPPINLKFFGTAVRRNGDRRAFLLHGDDVFLASPGDIVERRYKVISIAVNSIVIEDLPNSNRQTLPLQAN